MVFVICEAGKNWLTDENISSYDAYGNAKELASAAKECGADAVKFQCHVAEDEVRKRHPKRHDWIRLNEQLTPYKGFWEPLKAHCDYIGIEFMVTPMSKMAAQKMDPFVNRWKVASPDVLDYDLLEFLKETGKEIILSSGMTEKKDQDKAVQFLGDCKILHCISEYPCPVKHLNLWEMKYYDGLSDHSRSLITGALATVLGATICEKHFTINGWGKDAYMSLELDEMMEYIDNIKEAEKTLIENKRPTETEKELLKDFWYEAAISTK